MGLIPMCDSAKNVFSFWEYANSKIVKSSGKAACRKKMPNAQNFSGSHFIVRYIIQVRF